jgi:hypothetical protein
VPRERATRHRRRPRRADTTIGGNDAAPDKGTIMSALGCGFSILAGFFLLLGLIPLLGWLNWITTLPLALLGATFCYQAMKTRPADGLAKLGLIASVLVFAFGAFRLSLGAGVI